MAVAVVAVMVWAAKLIGIGTAIGLLAVSLGLWALSRQSLEIAPFSLALTIPFLCGGLLYDGHNIQLHTLGAVLNEFPEIDRVWLRTNEDVTVEVEGLWFSTVDQPEVVFQIGSIDGSTKTEIRKKLKLALRERRQVPLPTYVSGFR